MGGLGFVFGGLPLPLTLRIVTSKLYLRYIRGSPMLRRALYDCRLGHLRACDAAGIPIKLGALEITSPSQWSHRVWNLGHAGEVTLAWRENGGKNRFADQDFTECKLDNFLARIRRRSIVHANVDRQTVHVLFNPGQGDIWDTRE